jgi:hypothetical protein
MNFTKINVDDIVYTQKNSGSYSSIATTIRNKSIQFTTPPLRLPFGIQKYNTSYTAALQFMNYNKKNFEIMSFLCFIQSIEDKHRDYIETDLQKDRDLLRTQLQQKNPKYDPLLQSKIYMSGGQIKTVSLDKDKRPISLFDIKKGSVVKCELHMNPLYNFKDSYVSKFVIYKITVISEPTQS